MKRFLDGFCRFVAKVTRYRAGRIALWAVVVLAGVGILVCSGLDDRVTIYRLLTLAAVTGVVYCAAWRGATLLWREREETEADDVG